MKIKSICVSRILSQRFMTVLKNKNHKQWKQAQARISVSPLASRISGYKYGERSYHLVCFSKVSSSREGCSCRPRFWRECLSQKAINACPGRWILTVSTQTRPRSPWHVGPLWDLQFALQPNSVPRNNCLLTNFNFCAN